jgi:hypothetical protein
MVAELDRNAPIPSIPSTLPVGLPSDLLRRRPDVRAAERELGAATAQIGVAVSDLYPKFDLIGAVGFTGSSLGTLASGGNLGEFGLGSITWPLFHWDQTNANIRVKEEEEQQAYYAYQKVVLGAVQNVEDALSRYTTEQQRLVALERAETAAKSSTAIATQQFRVGTVTYVNVLVAEVNELSVRDQLAQSRQLFATDLISLYKALGGGWVADVDIPTANRTDATASINEDQDAPDRPALRLTLRPDVDNAVRTNGTNEIVDGSSGLVPAKRDDIALKSQSVSGRANASEVVPSSPRSPSLDGQPLSGPQLQLGAWRSEAAAMEGWNRAARKAGDLLKGHIPHIVTADLPGKGRYYRLRTEAATSADSARLCEALMARGLACILAR